MMMADVEGGREGGMEDRGRGREGTLHCRMRGQSRRPSEAGEESARSEARRGEVR